MSEMKQFDVIIIGGSYSGLAAAMALGRALRKVLVIDSGLPCNRQTPQSHNFLTQDGKPPKEIANVGKQQVMKYETVEFLNELAIQGTALDKGFEIQTASGKLFQAMKLIFATGIIDQMPSIGGFAECWGISILHCPYCHGYEVRGVSTGILGNGEQGFEFAKLISNWTKNITIFTNSKAGFTPEQTKMLSHHNIRIEEKEIQKIIHTEGSIENIVFKDNTTTPIEALYAPLPFTHHCIIPQQLGCALSEEGYLKTDSMQKTNVKGVFVCGDNASKMRTVANAVSMGTTAGMMLNKELIEEYFTI